MDGFLHRHRELYCEDVPVSALAARYGTPLYVYSKGAFLARLGELRDAFAEAKPLICYSVKASGNLSLLRLMARAGAGFDVVSGGELFRVLKAGGKASKVVFAGVGKTEREIAEAVSVGIRAFNVESVQELQAIDRAARRARKRARALLRLNPDVDANTVAKTTTAKRENKFGIDLNRARDIFAGRRRFPSVDIEGVHLHLGSPMYTTAPFRRGLIKAARFIAEVRAMGAEISTVNVGGGYCISYDGRKVIGPADYAAAILPAIRKLGVRLILEPGRYIAGNSGILLTKVTYVKRGWSNRTFVVLDAGMNDLLRPAMYDAYHHIWPVKGPASPVFGNGRPGRKPLQKVDIVGPICETSDCFAKGCRLPSVKSGDLIVVYSAGAYGMSMSSTYNARPRPAEVLVSGKRYRLIRKHETYADLIRGEQDRPRIPAARGRKK